VYHKLGEEEEKNNEDTDNKKKIVGGGGGGDHSSDDSLQTSFNKEISVKSDDEEEVQRIKN
jgi:hypothetical protein